MILQMLSMNITFVSINTIFEMFPMQNILWWNIGLTLTQNFNDGITITY